MEPKYIKISDLNRYIKAKFDIDTHLNKVYLKGEISNFKNHTRGHLYFTLKDESSRIAAVMFASSAKNLTFTPEDGMNVLVSGRVSVYEATGGYQIYVEDMQLDGIGNLYLEYEKLKKKLESEGLFNKDHKKPIPKFPKKIGIVTASTGAAIRDILSTIKRRYPICETILFPSLVQGELAKDSIVKQLAKAQEYDLDVIICGRGGGSIEDLWAFNEEIVARAIYNSRIPIISAVGHEVDFTIADFVADLRAPTPTGAAEMAVPNLVDINNLIEQYRIRLNESINKFIAFNEKKLDNIKNSFILKNPLAMYEVKEQKLDSTLDKLNQIIKNILERERVRLDNIVNKQVLKEPIEIYLKKKDKIALLVSKSTSVIQNRMMQWEHDLKMTINSLELLNPLSILNKGYSVVYKEDKIMKSTKGIKVNDQLKIRLYEGNLNVKVEEVNK